MVDLGEAGVEVAEVVEAEVEVEQSEVKLCTSR